MSEKKKTIGRLIIIVGSIMAGLAVGIYATRTGQVSNLAEEETKQLKAQSFHEGHEWGYLKASIEYRLEAFEVVLPLDERDRVITFANLVRRRLRVVERQLGDTNMIAIMFDTKS
jgi:hypothetical protein